MTHLERALEKFGLNQKQARTYLACLELGSSTVQKISQKAGLARSTTYEILESLKEKGLITTFRRKTVKCFTAEEPEKIIREAKMKAKMLEKCLEGFNNIQLKSRFQPTVRFYQGKRGIYEVLDEILREAKELLSFNSPRDVFAELNNFLNRFVQKRVSKKIPIKIICWDSPLARERQKLGPKQLRQMKIIPPKYQYHGSVMVWKNKIAMFTLLDDFEAVIIESPGLAAIQKALFNYMWDSLPN
ncbi:MAG: helix-turn-helix domain-containing protein [Patescibacteria group bacterium]|nr:helix-turn-helix domain-containing protein [Patescibacteria group bacterium]